MIHQIFLFFFLSVKALEKLQTHQFLYFFFKPNDYKTMFCWEFARPNITEIPKKKIKKKKKEAKLQINFDFFLFLFCLFEVTLILFLFQFQEEYWVFYSFF